MLFDPLRMIQHSTDIRFIISVKMDTIRTFMRATKKARQVQQNALPFWHENPRNKSEIDCIFLDAG